MAYPSSKDPGFVTMIETKDPFRAASLAAAVRRTGRAFVLGRGRGEAVSLRLATAGTVGVVGLSALTEPPANDAFPVRRLAFGAVARVAARPSVVSGASGGDGVFAGDSNVHSGHTASLKENPGGCQGG